MALLWINDARNSLSAVSNSYADIQRELDKYNKIFETYAHASPETQMRAASVMRQALNEYNGLKKQQEENSARMYELQSWVDYYNRNPQINIQSQQQETRTPQADIAQAAPTELIPIVATSTPGALNNNTPVTNVEADAIDTDATANVPTSVNTSRSTINPIAPVWTTKIISSQSPRYPNTSIRPVTQNKNNITWPIYWPGTVAPTPWTWWLVGLNSPIINTRRNWNKYIPLIRKTLTGIYNYLKR